MFAPESPDGVKQEIKRNWGRHDEDRNCCVESCDAFLKEGYGTCDEKGIDSGHLVVERVFHVFWGMEYEDSWWEGGYSWWYKTPFDLWDSLKQSAVT